MPKWKSPLCAGALALMAGALAAGPAGAAPVTSAQNLGTVTVPAAPAVEQVAYHGRRYHRGHRRYYGRHHAWRHHRHGYRHYGRYYRHYRHHRHYYDDGFPAGLLFAPLLGAVAGGYSCW